MKRTSVSYGFGHSQVADIWRPTDREGDRPVVALIHGGFWKQLYTKRLMHRMAAAVVAHGWVAYNIEYRRVGHLGHGGWPETFEDIDGALNALNEVEGIDRQRVVTCGHSAGGHLALWAATPRATTSEAPPHPSSLSFRVRAAISLAGVVDLVAASRLGLGGGAVDALMGGSPDQFPERYALGSPAAQLPLGVPQFLLHGTADSTVPASLSSDYVDAAVAAGDEAAFIPLSGASHMDMISPPGAAFHQITAILDRFSSPSG